MLSVIISTLNNERPLVRTLSALVPAAATGVVREVIVTDGGSSDSTLEVADIAGCNIASETGPLAQRLGAAAGSARSDWLMFLRPGTIPDPGWAEEVAQFLQRMEMAGSASAATFRRSTMFSPSKSALSETLGMVKSALFGRITPDQGLIIARQHYTSIGGHRHSEGPETDLVRGLSGRLVLLRSGAARAPD